MSEKMYPIPFKSLMNWVVTEYANSGEIFGVRKAYHATGKSLPIFGERIETPFGPAAGPNSQLAQNIIAAYFAGARFFGLSKEAAAEYSFILSIPAILGSLVLQIPDVAAEGLQGTDWGCVIVGTIVAAVSGYFAIRWMLRLITKKSLKGFIIYVAALGVLVLCDQLIFNVFFTNPF